MTLPQDDFERRLADLLRAEAETVTPAGDGLIRIRAGVERRRARLRWLRPTLGVVTAAALGTSGFVAFTLGRADHEDVLRADRNLNGAPSTPSGPAVTTSASPAPLVSAATGAAGYLLWPFTRDADAASWRVSGGPSRQPDYLDAGKTALAFTAYLGISGLRADSQADEPEGTAVTLTRDFGDGRQSGVAVVHLRRSGSGSGAPWVVRLVGSYGLQITEPRYGAAVTSPVHVRTSVIGLHHSTLFEVWQAGSATALGAPVSGTGGESAPPSADVPFAGSRPGPGMLVAREYSDKDGGIAKVTAVPVALPGTAVPPPDYPAEFVAASNGSISAFRSLNGLPERTLTGNASGATDSDPALVGDAVYFLRSRPCADPGTAEIRRVPLAGGTSTRVVGGLPNGSTQLAVSADGRMLAWVQTSCSGAASLRTLDTRTSKAHSYVIGNPPLVEGAPSWAPDDRHLAFRYGRSGGGAQGYPVVVLDTATAATLADAIPVGTGAACDTGRPSYAPDGSLVLVTCAGTKPAVIRLAGGKQTVLFTFPSTASRVTDAIASVDVSADGTHVLVSYADPQLGGAGARIPRVYRWASGSLTRLAASATSPSW